MFFFFVCFNFFGELNRYGVICKVMFVFCNKKKKKKLKF